MAHDHKFGKVVVVGDDAYRIPVLNLDGSIAAEVAVTSEQYPEALIELLATYDIEPASMSGLLERDYHAVMLKDFFAGFKDLTVFYDSDEQQYGASAKNGDTGHRDHEFGISVAQAVANLARAHGFKSNPQGGFTLRQWFVDFAYGFERISEEQLQAELDGIFNPDKGAW